jgi:hypothetical protein
MKLLNGITVALIIGFIATLIWTTITAEFWSESRKITALIWGKVMLIDLFIGLLIIATFIYFLGNVSSLSYLLFRLKKIKSIIGGV